MEGKERCREEGKVGEKRREKRKREQEYKRKDEEEIEKEKGGKCLNRK